METRHIEKHLDAIVTWQKDHERHDDARFTSIENHIAALPNKDEVREIIRDVLVDTLFSVGRGTKMTIVTIATIVAAIGVISGGFKWLLGAIGLEYVTNSR